MEKIILKGKEMSVLKQTVLPDGKLVSTVLLDHPLAQMMDMLFLDQAFNRGPGLYETMVFPNETDRFDIDCIRYKTEEEALAGHEAAVKKWTSSTPLN